MDIAFNAEDSVGRIPFPALLELRIRGKYYHRLSDIDAPRLQVLIIVGDHVLTRRRARESLETTVKDRAYALRPTRELEIGVTTSTQTLQTLLDCSPALEKLTLRMIGQEYDRELLRLLLFPLASPEEEGDENGNDREVEWETLRHGILLQGERDIVQKTRAQNMCSLTILLERVLTDEDSAIWERCLQRFENAVKGGKDGEWNPRFKCLPMGQGVS